MKFIRYPRSFIFFPVHLLHDYVADGSGGRETLVSAGYFSQGEFWGRSIGLNLGLVGDEMDAIKFADLRALETV